MHNSAYLSCYCRPLGDFVALSPDYWLFFFWIEHVQRFVEKFSKIATYVVLFTCYLGILPWLGFLFGALKPAIFLKRDTLFFV